MNCIEALQEQLKECFPCRVNAKIIEFEQLPEEYKHLFDYYDKNEHYLIHCQKCDVYKILPE